MSYYLYIVVWEWSIVLTPYSITHQLLTTLLLTPQLLPPKK